MIVSNANRVLNKYFGCLLMYKVKGQDWNSIN